jgi:predicted O-methyltransferase YrrM
MIKDLIFLLKNKTKTKVIILFLFNKIFRIFLKSKIKKFKRDHKIYLLKKKVGNDYFSMNSYNFYKCLSNLKNDFKYLEIGSYEGNSAIFVAKYFTESNIFCVDTWMGSDEHLGQNFREIEKNFLYNINEFKNIHQIKSPSNLFFLKNKEFYDCVYIDGDHNAEQVFLDCQNAWSILTKGGYLICDDYTWKFYKENNKNPCYGINKFLNTISNFQYYLVSNSQIFIKKN